MTESRHTPLAAAYDWQLSAACRDADASLFFHPDGERGADRLARLDAAKAVCGGCAVRAECLHWALEKPESYGVWGGASEDEREAILARRRQAPADESVAAATEVAALPSAS